MFDSRSNVVIEGSGVRGREDQLHGGRALGLASRIGCVVGELIKGLYKCTWTGCSCTVCINNVSSTEGVYARGNYHAGVKMTSNS